MRVVGNNLSRVRCDLAAHGLGISTVWCQFGGSVSAVARHNLLPQVDVALEFETLLAQMLWHVKTKDDSSSSQSLSHKSVMDGEQIMLRGVECNTKISRYVRIAELNAVVQDVGGVQFVGSVEE